MKKIFWILGAIIIIVIGVYIFNYVTLIQPTTSKISNDNRNEGISVDVHYKFYIFFNILEYNLKNVPANKAAMDVFRVFLQTSSALKDKKFKKVELSFKGTIKFVLNGDYFRQLGNEFGTQNPIFTMRTFPENLYNSNGEAVYSKWEGGMLGVFSKQMNDFNDFNKKWYLDELIGYTQK
jgi:hypothetical protein